MCHAATCSKGGFTITRHNTIRDLMASPTWEVEPSSRLQPLSRDVSLQAGANRDLEVQLNVKAKCLWGDTFECAFLDVRASTPRTLKRGEPFYSLGLPPQQTRQATPVQPASSRCGDGFIHASRLLCFWRQVTKLLCRVSANNRLRSPKAHGLKGHLIDINDVHDLNTVIFV